MTTAPLRGVCPPKGGRYGKPPKAAPRVRKPVMDNAPLRGV
jgi:hypothetical protein